MHVCVSNASHPKRADALQASNLKDLFVPSAIIFSVALADQITKILAVHFLSEIQSVRVLGDFLLFTLVYNEGGALGTSFGPSHYYLIASLLVFTLVLYYIVINRSHRSAAYPLAFIAGGALGNIIDRIRLGKVVDWIDIDIINVNILGLHLNRWWTFNIADAAISCSIVFILATLLHSKLVSRKQHEEEKLEMSGSPETDINKK